MYVLNTNSVKELAFMALNFCIIAILARSVYLPYKTLVTFLIFKTMILWSMTINSGPVTKYGGSFQ